MIEKDKITDIAAVILAAGKGKRMKSGIPKVLHTLGGRPIIEYVIKTVKSLDIKKVVVVIGHKGEMVEDYLKSYQVDLVWQKELLGTGHALAQTKSILSDFAGTLLVLCGDVPFLSPQTLREFIQTFHQTKTSATVLTAVLEDPKGYGRVIRGSDDFVEEIVEHKDATPEERCEKEINTGTFCFDSRLVFSALEQVKRENRQGEYYLTDVVKILRKNSHQVSAFQARDYRETMGVNSLKQLQQMERLLANGEIKVDV